MLLILCFIYICVVDNNVNIYIFYKLLQWYGLAMDEMEKYLAVVWARAMHGKNGWAENGMRALQCMERMSERSMAWVRWNAWKEWVSGIWHEVAAIRSMRWLIRWPSFGWADLWRWQGWGWVECTSEGIIVKWSCFDHTPAYAVLV